MKRKGMLFAMVLAIGMGMTMPAMAEETNEQGLGDLIGSLFQDGGLVDGLLGEDGAVSNYLSDEKTMETINGLFGEDGPLAGVIPEDVDISGVLETVGSQLSDANSTLHQGIDSVVDMVTDENGSIDWEKIEGSVGDLFGVIAGGGKIGSESAEGDEEDIDALIAELMIPYNKADEVMFAYVGEKNADLMDAGDVQIFSKKTGYMDDPEQDEVKVLGDFTQVNFAIDGDQMNMVSAATDTILFTLARDEEGNYTVVDEKYAEDGEGYSASVEAMCGELGIPVEDFYSGTLLGAYNDADKLADYLDEHPEITTAEFQGEQMTAEELRALSDGYIEGLFDAAFGADEEEELTEAVTE